MKELEQIKRQNEAVEQQLHVGFLYASPLIYEDQDQGKKGYQVPPQLTFRNEIQAIKTVLKGSN